jgi:hypothetical protein
MKAPREILWSRHAETEPDLDALRERIVGRLRPQPATTWWTNAWHELLWQPRLIWAGLAAVWLVILGGNRLALRPADPTPVTYDLATALERQQAIYAEFDLLRRNDPAPAPSRTPSPQSSLHSSHLRHFA